MLWEGAEAVGKVEMGAEGVQKVMKGNSISGIAEGFMILGWSPQSRAGSGQAEGRADRAVEEGSQRLAEAL